MQTLPTECTFCLKFGCDPSGNQHPVFDTAIWENENFVVVPAIGSLVAGYVLIITRTHFRSMAHLPDRLLSELQGVILRVREMLTQGFGPPVIFEHGLVCNDVGVGSCIDHAHLHAVPTASDILSRLESLHEVRRIKSLDDIVAQVSANQSYLYFETQDEQKFLLTGVTIPSQYLRRLIAEEVGIPNQWDWAVFDFENNARATLKSLMQQIPS